ncbi:MAG: peptidyl-prolyl cis-trans isomerase [Planctomycetes bacterium]|nr:peptidyl-prolyl cis-trans isomerase [Planctomycetota bacterium]
MRAFGHLLLASALPLLPAQVNPPTEKGRPGRVLVDTVVATVNDAAIMLSTINGQIKGLRRTEELRRGSGLRPSEIHLLLSRALDAEIARHSMAQSAKSFGVATPQQVEDLVADELKRDEESQVRDLGTWQKYSAELKRQGNTWQTYWREKRIDKLSDLAEEFAINMRMQKQHNLFLTPRMLRETYRTDKARFQNAGQADIAIVLFTGADAERQATTAAGIWAQQELTAAQLIAAVPGSTGKALPTLAGITDASREALSDAIVDFALAGPQDRVSAPIPVAGGFQVAKILAYAPPRAGRFEDADVQHELRRICLRKVTAEFKRQANNRASDRTEVWRSRPFR